MTPSNQRLALQMMYDAINFLILNPEHQTTDYLARDGKGRPVAPTDPAACQWCALGRIAHDLDLSVPPIPLAPFQGIDHIPLDYRLNDRRLTEKLREKYLEPLGFRSFFFVQRNDRSDPVMRKQGLEEIAETLASHPALLKGY